MGIQFKKNPTEKINEVLKPMVTWAILNIGLDILPWVTKRVVVKLVGPLSLLPQCFSQVAGENRVNGPNGQGFRQETQRG